MARGQRIPSILDLQDYRVAFAEKRSSENEKILLVVFEKKTCRETHPPAILLMPEVLLL